MTTLTADKTVIELNKRLGVIAKFYTDVNKFQRHKSEDGNDPEDFPEGSYEQTVAEAARDAQESVNKDFARGKPKRKRKPSTDQRIAAMEEHLAKILEKLEG